MAYIRPAMSAGVKNLPKTSKAPAMVVVSRQVSRPLGVEKLYTVTQQSAARFREVQYGV